MRAGKGPFRRPFVIESGFALAAEARLNDGLLGMVRARRACDIG